jgi:hypothetical protein
MKPDPFSSVHDGVSKRAKASDALKNALFLAIRQGELRRFEIRRSLQLLIGK